MSQNLTAVGTNIDWAGLSGVILDGGCELKDVLTVRENAAELRVRILGSGGRQGVAYFQHLDPAAAEDQLEIWHTLREVPHPNLSRPLAVGRRQVSGIETVYLVLADADEKLAAVIPERPLEWEEAAEVLHSVEQALAHLHAHGLIHGSVSPETVLAVGYTIQLDTATVRRAGTRPRLDWTRTSYLAPESRDVNTTPAADVWCLGATLFEVLSQQRYGTPGAQLEKGLPLAAVIARCLEKDPVTRCSLKETPALEDAAAAPAPAAPLEALPVVEAPPAPPPPAPDQRTPGATTARGTAARLPQPLTPKPAARQVTKEDMALVPVGKRHRKVQGKRQGVDARIRTLDAPTRDLAEDKAGSSAPAVAARIVAVGHKSRWLRATLAGLTLALLFGAAVWFVILPKLQAPVEPLVTGESLQAAAEPRSEPPADSPLAKTTDGSNPVPALPVVTPAPQTSAPLPKMAEPLPEAPPPPPPIVPVKREFFRVVIGGTATQRDAYQRMRALSKQYPDFLMHVSPAQDDLSHTLFRVVAGGALSQAEAAELRRRLVAEGVPAVAIEQLHK